jgi:hypothetical protein
MTLGLQGGGSCCALLHKPERTGAGGSP